MVSCRTHNAAPPASWRFKPQLLNAQSSSERDGAFTGKEPASPAAVRSSDGPSRKASAGETRCAEVAALHDGYLRRIHVTPERGVHLLERERLDSGVKLRIPFKRPAVRFA